MQREGLGQVALHPEDNFAGYECQKVFLGGTLKVTAVAWALVTVTAFEGGFMTTEIVVGWAPRGVGTSAPKPKEERFFFFWKGTGTAKLRQVEGISCLWVQQLAQGVDPLHFHAQTEEPHVFKRPLRLLQQQHT